MARRRYLVSYDVSDDKRRNRIFQTLRDNGDHAQYSVFFCELNARELASVRARLSELVHHQEDQVLILDLGEAANPLEGGLECIGRPYHPVPKLMVI